MVWTELSELDHIGLMPPIYRSDTGWRLCYFRGLRYEWVLYEPDTAKRHTNAQFSATQTAEAQAWAESLMPNPLDRAQTDSRSPNL